MPSIPETDLLARIAMHAEWLASLGSSGAQLVLHAADLSSVQLPGVDLTDVPGISAITAHTILIEVGPDLSRFRNASAFASWLGLCPDKKVSGGKVLYTGSRKVQESPFIVLHLPTPLHGGHRSTS